MLLRLRDKAIKLRESPEFASKHTESQGAKRSQNTSISSAEAEDETSDELSILRGTARVVQTQSTRKPDRRAGSDGSSPAATSGYGSGSTEGSRAGSGSPPLPHSSHTGVAEGFGFANFSKSGARAGFVESSSSSRPFSSFAQFSTSGQTQSSTNPGSDIDLSSYMKYLSSSGVQGDQNPASSVGFGTMPPPSQPQPSSASFTSSPESSSAMGEDPSDLALRSVLESLTQPYAPGAPVPMSGVNSDTGIQGTTGGMGLPFSSLDSGTALQAQASQPFTAPVAPGGTWSEQHLIWSGQYLASAFNLAEANPNAGPNVGPGPLIGVEGSISCDSNANSTTDTDASVIEAWRAMKELPDFAELGVDFSMMDSVF